MNFFSNAASFYVRMFKRRPLLVLVVAVAYISTAGGYLVWMETRKATIRENEFRKRVEDTLRDLSRERQIVDRLTTTGSFSYLKDIHCEEHWQSPESKARTERLLEYAKFASDKRDYDMAHNLLIEASTTQRSFSASYGLARILYARGDLEGADKKLAELIEMDSGNKYPALRLYRALLNGELGRNDEARNLLAKFSKGD